MRSQSEEPTVYRPTVTRALPEGAEVFEEAGKTFARFTDSKGEPQTRAVTVPDKGPHAGTKRIVIESSFYVARYRDASGVLRTVSTQCRTEKEARARLADLCAEVQRQTQVKSADGKPAKTDPETILFAVVLRRYLAYQKSRQANPSHLADIERRAKRLARNCRLRYLADLKPSVVRKWFAEREAEGMTAAMRNRYLAVLAGLGEWCVRTGLLAASPTAGIERFTEQGDLGSKAVVAKKRSLTEEELDRLVQVALLRPLAEYGRSIDVQTDAGSAEHLSFVALTVDSMSAFANRARKLLKADPVLVAKLEYQGWKQALVYKLLVLAGLRRSELVSLQIGSLDLDASTPYLVAGGRAAGSAESVRIPLREDLAVDLRRWLGYLKQSLPASQKAAKADMPVETLLFKLPGALAKTLDRDLHAANIAQVDSQGCVVDVYAVRTGRGGRLAVKGKPLPSLRTG